MHKLTIAVTAAALTLVPVSAAATGSSAHLAAKKTPKPPATGHWAVVNDTNGPEVTGGSMIVTKGHKDIRSLVVKLGTDAETACGSAGETFKIAQKQKIFDARGDLEFGGTYNEWAVGRNDENADPVIQPRVVTLTINGKSRKAKYWMVFQHGTKGNGEILFNKGACQLDFGVKKG